MDEMMYLFLVGLLWGVTNPLIKKGSAGVSKVEGGNVFVRFFKDIKFFVTNWKCMIPFLVNQSGSVLYYFTLKSANLTFAVPITNSVAFLVTAITGWCLGESAPKPRTILGSSLIVLGTACYIFDKT
ncbi:transmembrane protein 234 homolog isoform X1 [Homalodisca vitripennis]|uniref:transmembrane protein 234 homolog isoform X1 n=2 Tax=Homalodisca vitripennis TaxID=197043 RepID=UPI001EEC6798|nr:transmembrane protein 234 homolog isoform X1 [Homalodisca vitripennis]